MFRNGFWAAALMLGMLCGCAMAPAPDQAQTRKPAGSGLLEVATIVGSDGSRNQAVLSREDIANALGGSVETQADWKGIVLPREKLVEALRRTRFGSAEAPGKAEYAELFLKGCTVSAHYSLATLGVKDAGALLEKYFEKREGFPGDWWIRKRGGDDVRENGLVELMKGLGFEATRGEAAPVLFVRRAGGG